jgi:polysaccharide export outer membrane protein
METLKKLLALTFLMLLFTLESCSTDRAAMLPNDELLDSAEYLIGPGDQLRIFVWRNADLTSSVVVRPDGRISSPLIDDLVVIGMKATDVAQKIEDILSVYIRDPKVSVIVSGFKGTSSQQIRVIGNATNPKVIPYRAGMTLLDVMIDVQGLSDFADGDNAKLIRRVDGKNKQYSILLDTLIRKGDIRENRALHPGDTIIIPEPWL